MASTPELFSSANNTLLYGNHYSELSELTVPPSTSEFCDRGATRSNICTEEDLMLPCNLNDFCLLEGFLSSSSSSSSEKLETVSCDGVVPSFSSNEYHSYISGCDHNGGNFQETVYNNTNNNSNIVPLDNNNTLDKLFSGECYNCCASTSFSPEFKPLSLVAGEQSKRGIQSNNQLNGLIEDPNMLKVGRYSEEEKKERIVRYLKKRNQRNFNKTIKYACRKTLADRRVRVRGRFARNNNNELYHHHDDQQIEPEKINVDDQDRKDVKICCDDGLQVVNDEDWLQNFAYCVAGLMEDQLFN